MFFTVTSSLNRLNVKMSLSALLLASVITGIGGSFSVEAANPVVQVTKLQTPKGSEKVRKVTGKITIDAPRTAVWESLTQYGDLARVMPGYKRFQVVPGSSPKQLDIQQKVSGLLPSYNYRVQVAENRSAYQITYKRISGDFDALLANYQLLPAANGNQTLLMYQLTLEDEQPLPAMAVNGILKDNTEKTLSALATHAEQQYQSRLIGKR